MKIAVVDGFATGRFLVEELNRAGAACVHAQSQSEPPPAYVRAFDAALYEHDFGYVNDYPALRDAILRYGVDAVVAGSESGVLLADRLAADLGLPGNAMEYAEARRDKYAMVRRVADCGLDAPDSARVFSPAEAVAWYSNRGDAEVVVKPLSSAGTDGVRICRTEEELASACASILASRDFFGKRNQVAVVQERLVGTEFYVNSVSVDGLHKIAEAWAYTKTVGAAGEPIYDFETPVLSASAEMAVLFPYVQQVLDAVGIRNGAAHTEVMLTSRGPVLIETGARLGGGTIPWVSQKFSGVSQTSLFAGALTAPAQFEEFDHHETAWSHHVRNVALIAHQQTTVRSDAWKQRIESLPSLVTIASRISPGRAIPATVDLITSPGFIYLASESADEVARDYATLRAWEHQDLYGV